MKLEGLEELSRKLKELAQAMAALDGEIAQLSFNHNDPASIEQAIQQMNAAVDARVGSYASNQMVAGIAAQLKENARQGILERAQAARLVRDSNNDN